MNLVPSEAQPPRVYKAGEAPDDERLGALRQLNSFFPARDLNGSTEWPARQEQIRLRIRVSQGLWPLPEKAPLRAVIHGRVKRNGYVVDRVFFESIPGHFVTGSLYRPLKVQGKIPAILSPHGHWNEGRFYEATDSQIQSDLKSGAENDEVAARVPIQARAVQLARMGCLVFVYDMTGNADSIQLGHRPDHWEKLNGETGWGFASTQAELRLQNMMGLQTWNSIRAIDFLLELPETDAKRIGVTGASGGGTQSMIIGAVDERIAAAMPCVMVSTSMQGGCTCENASHLRVGQGNIDIAAAIAPRPLGLTAADDWTVELKTKGYPDLRRLFTRLGRPQNLTAAFHTEFKHNYNLVNRSVMYDFFNRHFGLGFDAPIQESPFRPLDREEATVWTASHPAPKGPQVGDAHEVALLHRMDRSSDSQMASLIPTDQGTLDQYHSIVNGGWEVILGMDLPAGESPKALLGSATTTSGFQVRPIRLRQGNRELPVLEVRPTASTVRGTVVWLTDQGKSGLFEADQLCDEANAIAQAGYRILAPDLYGQGEFATGSRNPDVQPMWFQREGKESWHRFCGYTYGYNLTRFSQRTRDTLTVLEHAQSGAADASAKTYLIAEGSRCGPVAIAATGQHKKGLDGVFVDPHGFRFGSVQNQDDANFVPGAIRYLGMDGLLSLCGGAGLTVVDKPGPATEAVNRIIRTAGPTNQSIRFCDDRDELWRRITDRLGHRE